MRLLRLFFATTLIVVVLIGHPAPAGADTTARSCAFLGTMHTGPLWLATSGPAAWSVSSTLDVCVTVPGGPVEVGAGNIAATGSLTGRCGLWTGTGTLRVGSHSVPADAVTVGYTTVMRGFSSADHTIEVARMLFFARPVADVGQIPCVTVPGTTFDGFGSAGLKALA